MKKLFTLGLMLFMLTGCATLENFFFDPSEKMNKTAQQLAAEGAQAFLDEDYREAVKAYTDLKDWYPFSKYAILAELKIADSHFRLEAYDEAIVAYESFEKLHPRNEAVPYVVNQIGLCWFNQIDTVDRDPTPAQNAMTQFRRVLEQFPGSEYAPKADEKIEKCLDTIAGHELYVANYLKKTKEFKAALKRYEYITAHYPGTAQSEVALKQIPETAKLAEKQEKK